MKNIVSLDPYFIGILDRRLWKQMQTKLQFCLDPHSIGMLDRRLCVKFKRAQGIVLILTLLEY